jgi:hypothetical protein
MMFERKFVRSPQQRIPDFAHYGFDVCAEFAVSEYHRQVVCNKLDHFLQDQKERELHMHFLQAIQLWLHGTRDLVAGTLVAGFLLLKSIKLARMAARVDDVDDRMHEKIHEDLHAFSVLKLLDALGKSRRARVICRQPSLDALP